MGYWQLTAIFETVRSGQVYCTALASKVYSTVPSSVVFAYIYYSCSECIGHWQQQLIECSNESSVLP